MSTIKYNPGNIPGHIVMRKVVPKTIEVTEIVGTTWEERDLGDWRGLHKVQVPVYETKKITVLEPADEWTVYTEKEYNKQYAALSRY